MAARTAQTSAGRMHITSVARHLLFYFWISDKLRTAHNYSNVGPEHRLYANLFQNYSAESRPVSNASHPVIVNFAISLNQLLDLDEKNQVLTTSVWIYEDWKDENLVWKPKLFGNQQILMIPATNVWLPDIFIFNTAGDSIDGYVNVTGSKVSVKHSGRVRWMIPFIINSACAVDVTYFPYDQQICQVKFGSWIYDLSQLDLRLIIKEPDLQNYVMNSEYDLVNVSLTREVLGSSCCPGSKGQHAMISLQIHLKRKSLYYDYIVIAPTIMLCVLTLASFLLPCHRGEKIAIGLTVFLTLYVLQLRIADNVPDTNSTPILGVFLFVVMTFNCISLIMATIIMNIKKRGDEKQCPDVPGWLLWLCHQVLSRIVCTRYLWKDDIPFPEDNEDTFDNHQIKGLPQRHQTHSNYVRVSTEDTDVSPTHKRRGQSYPPSAEIRTPGNACERITSARSLSTLARVAAPGERMFHMKRQWFFVAEVVDKFAFVIYLVTMSFTILMILYIVPVYMRND